MMNIAVHPDYRRRGLAEMLVAELVAALKNAGNTCLTLEVRSSNVPAIALYESFGFQTAGRRKGYYEDNGEDALIMWRQVVNE
jgi:ribosomal-protein-alanine N-acetyltransferase